MFISTKVNNLFYILGINILKTIYKKLFYIIFFSWLEKILYLSFQSIYHLQNIKEFCIFSKIGLAPIISLVFYIFQSNSILLFVRKIIISYKKRFKLENRRDHLIYLFDLSHSIHLFYLNK